MTQMSRHQNQLHLCQAQASRIIYLPETEMKMEVTCIGGARAKENGWEQTCRSHGKDQMQSLIMQDSQDPAEDMEEINIEAKLLEIELRQ